MFRKGASRTSWCLLLCILALHADVPLTSASNVFARMYPLGDKGPHGAYGPQGRHGHLAISTDDSKVIIWGGRNEFPNGDFMNDMWLFDWNTGNWTAYQPNEIVCTECAVCGSLLSNIEQGHKYIKDDTGQYIKCEDHDTEEWMERTAHSRAMKNTCQYHTKCYDWTGLRPYTMPLLPEGFDRNERAVPSGRYEHDGALVLNRDSMQRDMMVVFGGYSTDCGDYCNDLWHYHLPRNMWVKVDDSVRPRPARRWKHSMAAYEDVVFMFGGHGAKLEPRTPGTEVRMHEIYDTRDDFDPTNPLFFHELWSYNATEREWELLNPECTTCDPDAKEIDGTPERDPFGPRGRHSASIVVVGDAESAEKKCLIFGGNAYGGLSHFDKLYPTGTVTDYPSLESKYYLNDLWQYDIVRNEWTEIFPHPVYSQKPSKRMGHSAAISILGEHTIMLIFGGFTWDDEIGDLWHYNVSSNVWTKVTGEGQFPSRRTKLSMVPVGQAIGYRAGTEPQAGRMMIFGGHGCLSGETYEDATKSYVAVADPNGWDIAFDNDGDSLIKTRGYMLVEDELRKVDNPDLWVQRPNAYGEKYCIEELADLWQYYPTSCPRDCSRHGICEFNSCVCETGFTGIDCSNVSCPADECIFDYLGRQQVCFQCNGRGICNGYTGQCQCAYPSSGPSCDQVECLNDCNGNGICDKEDNNTLGFGKCSCYTTNGRTAYKGLDCRIPVCPWNPSPNLLIPEGENLTCNNRGTCINGSCVCFPGFGDSFLYRLTEPPEGQEMGVRIPVDWDGNDIEGCGEEFEGTIINRLPTCQPIYINDCGDIMFQLADARSLLAGALLAILVAVLLACDRALP